MRLVQQGKLELDAPVDRYLTRWRLPPAPFDADGVTIRRLLSHTAGLNSQDYSPIATRPLPSLEQSLSGESGGVDARRGSDDVRITMTPGAQRSYSNGGYTLLQLAIEEVTGEPFARYMQREVLDLLGMKPQQLHVARRPGCQRRDRSRRERTSGPALRAHRAGGGRAAHHRRGPGRLRRGRHDRPTRRRRTRRSRARERRRAVRHASPVRWDDDKSGLRDADVARRHTRRRAWRQEQRLACGVPDPARPPRRPRRPDQQRPHGRHPRTHRRRMGRHGWAPGRR